MTKQTSNERETCSRVDEDFCLLWVEAILELLISALYALEDVERRKLSGSDDVEGIN
jgi:hypothetical protein